jgi:hypothetical protein
MISLAKEGRAAEAGAVPGESRAQEPNQVVAGDHFVKRGGMVERNVVAAHALQPRLVLHRVGRERHRDLGSAREERVDELTFGRHHAHVHRLGRHLRHRDHVVLAEIVDRLEKHVADGGWLPARRRMHGLHLLDRLLPVIAETHLA